MVKKIMITKGSGWYKDRVGEVFNVMERDLSGNKPEDDYYYYVEHPGNDVGTTHFVRKDNCVVLKTEPAASLDVLDLIANLARRVSELERVVKRLDIEKAAKEIDKAVVKKRQPTRDDIVRRAIEDVAKLVSESSYDKYQVKDVIDGGLEPFDPEYDEVVFEVNRDKRTVVALIRYKDEKKVWARGIAKCAPNDVFNAHIGKAIALRRALGLEVPTEYTNAPQPEKVRAGDLVRIYFGRDCDDYFENKIEGFSDRFGMYLLGDGWYSEYKPDIGDRIIDDTESTERVAQEAAANDR